MNSKPKLLFVYDHPRPDMWLDGLSAALNVLEEDFEVTRWNLFTDPIKPPKGSNEHIEPWDFYLGWGAFGSKVDIMMQKWKNEEPNKHAHGWRGLCIAGNATPPEGANNYDVLFYETKWYRPQIDFHPNIVQAFGVNTDIFGPVSMSTPVVWDYVGVGALANWKRWEKMIEKPGQKLVIGQYQKDNEEESLEIARKLIRGGVMVSNEVSPYELANIYYYSRTLYMPSTIYGGGERSVLEAMSCGLDIEIEPDNEKLKELLEIEHIPSHIEYAEQLKKGIMSVL